MPPADEILCGEIGSDDAGRWSEPLRLAPRDADAIETLVGEGVLELRDEAAGVSVAGVDHVGSLVLPSGRRLRVRPKVGDLVLLDWLAYVGDAPPIPPPPAAAGFALRGGFAALLARHFLAELEQLTRGTLRPAFAQERHDSTTVRGRLLPNALARAYHRLPNLPQSRRSRALDTPHHRVLAAALDRLPALLPPDAATNRRLGALNREWSQVDRHTGDLAARVTACASHCPPGYGAAVKLASLILLGASPSPAGPAAGNAFLVSLAGVWERALRRMCREVAPSTGWRPVPDAQRTKRWDDGPGLRDPNRWMTADVVLASGGRRWVLDAKYKRGYGDEERNDRFQMTAYAMAFHARRATLVYPTAAAPRARWRLLLAGQIGGQPTTIDSIELPMAVGPVECRAAMLDAMLSLGAGGECGADSGRTSESHTPSPLPSPGRRGR